MHAVTPPPAHRGRALGSGAAIVDQVPVEPRVCRWCLADIVDPSPRREFCSTSCRKRHWSRARYGDADGYGAVLAAAHECAGCGVLFEPPPARQGAHRRRYCLTCRPIAARDRGAGDRHD